MLRIDRSTQIITVPRFSKIPFLVHGFGTRYWRPADFKMSEEYLQFHVICLDQVHSDAIHVVRHPPARSLEGDALLTAQPHLLLTIQTADCLPVLIADERLKVIAAVHCGWRGTEARLAGKVVKKMSRDFGCKADELLVAFGPAIGPACYEVGEEVRESFLASALPEDVFTARPQNPGKYFLDLRRANIWELCRQGVRADRIFSITGCTHCEDLFLSYRRDERTTARMLSFIGLRE
jgi:YfiH family protein